MDDFFLVDYFTNVFLQKCKWNKNIPQFLKRETKNTIKENFLEGRLYSKVEMIRHSIIKTKLMMKASVKDKEIEKLDLY